MLISDWSSDVCSSDLLWRSLDPWYSLSSKVAPSVSRRARNLSQVAAGLRPEHVLQILPPCCTRFGVGVHSWPSEQRTQCGSEEPSQSGRASCRARGCQYV